MLIAIFILCPSCLCRESQLETPPRVSMLWVSTRSPSTLRVRSTTKFLREKEPRCVAAAAAAATEQHTDEERSNLVRPLNDGG